MLWTLFVVLLLAWMICVLVVNVGGVAIHLLLVVAHANPRRAQRG